MADFVSTGKLFPGVPPEYASWVVSVNMSRYHPELTVSSFMSASDTVAMVSVSEPMVAVATADKVNVVAVLMASTVAPVGMPEPYTLEPGRMLAVLLTCT